MTMEKRDLPMADLGFWKPLEMRDSPRTDLGFCEPLAMRESPVGQVTSKILKRGEGVELRFH